MITIQQLAFRYPSSSKTVLHEISLSVAEGSLFGLLGPNGAGKTTLVSLISGLLPAPRGAITIDGRDMAETGAVAAAGVALVPQEYAFYHPLSVLENLRFFAGVQGVDARRIAERVAEAAAMTGLEDRLNDRAENLSGGLKRRLNLAIGLLNEPKLLLLDEPTVGIDPHSRHFILETIRTLNQQGVTVIYTSHYMEEVEQLCDRIAIVDQGEIILQGDLEELLHQQGGDSLTIELEQPMTQAQSNWPLSDDGRRIEIPHQSVDQLAELLPQLQPFGIRRIDYGHHNLESLFLDLTHRRLRD